MPLNPETQHDRDEIDRLALLLMYKIQAMTRCSDQAAQGLRQALVEFAEEIKRQAIEP